jgi:NADPH:quinone reductase-like Zn-dependent oxidoreductase
VPLYLFRYAEFMLVNDVSNLVKVPDELPLDVAATLPCGALSAYAAVERVKPFIAEQLGRSVDGM